MKRRMTYRWAAVVGLAAFIVLIAVPAAQGSEPVQEHQNYTLTLSPWSIFHLALRPGIANSPLSGLLFTWWASYSAKPAYATGGAGSLWDPPRYCGGEDGFIIFGSNGP